MTNTSLNVELVTPEKVYFSGSANMAVIPGTEGDFGVLPGHAPLISSIRPGVVEVHRSAGKVERTFITHGFAEVGTEGCIILAEEAINLASMDKATAQEKLEQTTQQLSRASTPSAQAKAQSEVEAAQALLDALQ